MSKLSTVLKDGVPLKSIHTYQYVVFQAKNSNFFTESKELGMLGLTLEYFPAIGAVLAKTAKDEVLVFCTNIAYARPLNADTAKANDLNRGKIIDKNPGDSIK